MDRVQVLSLIGQPVSSKAWKGSPEKHNKHDSNNVPDWNVIGQYIVPIPGPFEKPESLVTNRNRRDPKDVNVTGQKLSPAECVWVEHDLEDKRTYNVIGQTVISFKQKQQEEGQ